MRKAILSNVVLVTLVLASAPLSSAVAHEGHQMECNETAMNAMHADIQSMTDGEAKTTAMKEMKRAEETMAKNDMKACINCTTQWKRPRSRCSSNPTTTDLA